uniref:Uncharacterized protein n=1 Tax=Lactuca sativa TaxID=4236 RepID=A0A9R1W3R0_LACSA|nr:hypothetical protein LSAT_V11C300148390 [Lactuca sativa]
MNPKFTPLIPPCKNPYKLVEATEFFTRNVFFDIQSEILTSMVRCMSIRLEESNELKIFTMKDTEKHPKHHGQFEVHYKLQLYYTFYINFIANLLFFYRLNFLNQIKTFFVLASNLN